MNDVDFKKVRAKEIKDQIRELKEELGELAPPKQTWFNRGFRASQKVMIIRTDVTIGERQYFEGVVVRPGRKILSVRISE